MHKNTLNAGVSPLGCLFKTDLFITDQVHNRSRS